MLSYCPGIFPHILFSFSLVLFPGDMDLDFRWRFKIYSLAFAEFFAVEQAAAFKFTQSFII